MPAILLRKIDKMAEIGADRSTIIRLMVEHVLGHGSPEVEVYRSLLIKGLLGWKGRRRHRRSSGGRAYPTARAAGR